MTKRVKATVEKFLAAGWSLEEKTEGDAGPHLTITRPFFYDYQTGEKVERPITERVWVDNMGRSFPLYDKAHQDYLLGHGPHPYSK